MFGNKTLNKKIEYLQSRVDYLDSRVDYLEDRNKFLQNSKNEWEALAKKSNMGYDKGDLLIDWSKVDVVSIERAPLNRGEVNGVWITNVCYWKQEVENGLPVKKLKEMIYYTDMKQHLEIIETYNTYAKNLEKAKKK